MKLRPILLSAAMVSMSVLPQKTIAGLVNLPNPTSIGGLNISSASESLGAWGAPIASLTSSFEAPPGTGADFSGTLLSQVYNTGSGYTFVYTLTRTAGPDAIGRMTVAGWLSSEVLNVGNLNTSANYAQSADRTFNNSGKVVGFNFGNGLTGVAQLIVSTDLTEYFQETAAVSNGAATTAYALAVPEPTTLVAGLLLLLPFGASTLRRSRTA